MRIKLIPIFFIIIYSIVLAGTDGTIRGKIDDANVGRCRVSLVQHMIWNHRRGILIQLFRALKFDCMKNAGVLHLQI